MWNFSQLNLKTNSDFVGIKSEPDGYAFYLPKGFDNFIDKYQNAATSEDTDKFNKVRDSFFLMYRTLRKFDRDNENNSRVTRKDAKNKKNQDQVNLSTGGISLDYKEASECILYSKLSMIERILEAYDDLALNSIEKKARRSEEIDYSKIYKYLDRAIYLNNGAIYIDVMNLPRSMISHESTDIVDLYCFILDEIIQQLQEDVLDHIYDRSQDIQFLSQRFRDHYLTINHSLFDQDTFEETLSICKEALDNIDRNTHYKDADYWGLYEAIEIFLYGGLNPNLDDGDFWGIQGEQGFDYVWEDMCQTYFFKKNFNPIQNDFNKIGFADTDIPIVGYKNNRIRNSKHHRPESEQNRVGWWKNKSSNQWLYQKKQSEVDHPNNYKPLYWRELFCIEWDLKARIFPDVKYKVTRSDYPNQLRRYPQPDLVTVTKNEDSSYFAIVDFKNISLKKYEDYENKSLEETDKGYRVALEKQLGYELALQQVFPQATIGNYFFIPFYYVDKLESESNFLGIMEDRFHIRGIQIFKANFVAIQNIYLGITEASDFDSPIREKNYYQFRKNNAHASVKKKEIILFENEDLKSNYIPLITFQNEAQRKNARTYILEQVEIFFKEIQVDIPNLMESYFPYSQSIIGKEFNKINIDYFYDNLFYDLGEKEEDRDEHRKLKIKVKWCITFHIDSTPIQVPQLKIPNSDLCRNFGTIDVVGTPILYYIYFTLPEILNIIIKDKK
ncbi:sll0710 [Synechocystis sp. PCC 6803]|uniref:Sll0710 protein n=1 Tax=Synechocystis sp. (strain ATCC 27184 / PCC 6803 / Kazusa) TaxID=1111708 RepID=P72664_SYNY3|nr:MULTISPECIES: hypothetical protein [unclassified Synechocystis]BAM50367.1 hypothetical protein BEST7613_1436 [Synechocystis sp. PCC 6803] [Bacillus subtilis BEST7613]AGF50355.1 hypothetical protein MYO_1880 [Synechocystis sp. PCC 6803]ALJ66449.1 hypothetical protein AOY38_00450 [Synechocystis sp. PCC 6803]AVP88296.1 hypothetical protein C7I86_00455 [Synechocystis sp. IPPAS B-1465]MBD2619281.1 hypothetical protein [Synechocystis sp. FACHB-898]